MPSTAAATAAFAVLGPWLGLAPGSRAIARPSAAAAPGGAALATRGAAAGGEGQGASGRTLAGVALGLLSAAAWRRNASRRDTGRVVVYGRNYEKNIKTKKGPAEAKKAKVTAKHLNKIILSVREYGPSQETNPQLDRLMRSAMKDNVPKSTIENRIKTFVEGKESIIEVNVGGYGAGGTAILVECVTDNNTRTRTAVKEAFKEAGGQVGNDGCVDHLFNKQGVILFKSADEEAVVEASMEAEVEDCVAKDDGSVEVTTLPPNLSDATAAFEEAGLEPDSSEIVFAPLTETALSDGNAYELKRLLHLLDELDDVNEVHHNGAIPEDSLELAFSTYGIPWPYERALKEKK